MPKGNSKAYLNSPIYDNTEIDKEENALLINHCLEIFHLQEPDLSNCMEVKKAIDYYFESCLSKGLRPGNMGLYTALGLERREALNLMQGRIKKNVSPESLAYIKKACKALSLYRESLGSQGKLNRNDRTKAIRQYEYVLTYLTNCNYSHNSNYVNRLLTLYYSCYNTSKQFMYKHYKNARNTLSLLL